MTPATSTAYADCFSGISGDMFLGALLHAGLEKRQLLEDLDRLNLKGFEVQVANTNSCGIDALKVTIQAEPTREYRHLPAILDLLNNSSLPDTIISGASEVFDKLATAEARVHGISKEKVHFHEIGAMDTIIDVVGSLIGCHHLGITTLISAPLPMGRGFVTCAHGNLPLPAPAVCELLKGIPVYGVNCDQELITPTGAAILTCLAREYGAMPPMSIDAIGYGAGSHSREDNTPNLFRLILGTHLNPEEHQEVEIIETNLDDWNPEGYPYLCEQLLEAGALDVNLTAIQMKKGRPGFTLQVIANPASSLHLKKRILSETTALGLRFRKEQRLTLPRQVVKVKTPWGTVMAKKVVTPEGEILYPEYEECRRIAQQQGISLQRVYRAIQQTDTMEGK